ncbi:MAG: Bifunctional transcriptional activator/DNA repair enzyme Ada [Paracidovorax wautersii]|uniref:Bifunctional transcriptional activator/DNA repair enzyme Ada n=1 Tax=Paracidovorax wautersii TaxID=1177982 RepID=A0A7V8FR15_9BURK|nr:MAG: Bifunctional transcriptional activator/DNA repair enzyme Ada [Paracidovorax wautersii]
MPTHPFPLSADAPIYASDDARWQAVLTRDARADGHFVYAARTTGVYARPSTPGRRPSRAHVEFFATPAEAEAAGYRASRRQDTGHAEQVAQACRWLAEDDVPLAELAARLELSPFYFHRVFKAETGLTPKAYATAQRAQRVRAELAPRAAPARRPTRKAELAAPPRVTDAIFDAGYHSSSRFYSAAASVLGMRPSDYRDGGRGQEIRFAVAACSLGAILVARSARGVCAILLGDDADRLVRDLQDQFPRATLVGADAAFEQWVAEVVGFVERPALGLKLPLDIRGTAFQERVWQALREIAPGQTVSYTQIAEAIGAPRAVRAVAQACAANRLAVAVPCHRVVRRDGDLSGYRWGVERKRELLAREADVAPEPADK